MVTMMAQFDWVAQFDWKMNGFEQNANI